MKSNIKFLALGCRLNTVEAEKIRAMLADAGAPRAVIVNTCGVTAEAERQSKQAIRRIIRENSGAAVFVTGCAATRAPDDFAAIAGVTRVIVNKDKMNAAAYLCPPTASRGADTTLALCDSPQGGSSSDRFQLRKVSEESTTPPLGGVGARGCGPVGGQDDYVIINKFQTLSKGFVQIQNGCGHACTYCITRILRGRNVSFPYEQILAQVRALVANGYPEIVLTGVDIAGYKPVGANNYLPLQDLCRALLSDVPGMRRLRLSSLDPGTDLAPLIEIMREHPRMLPHMHLSMQSGSDAILARMGRRHNAQKVRELMEKSTASFSWDLICGFPGETQELFDETCALIRALKPIRLHAFPFSPRPGTIAATMPDQVPRAESKRRVNMAAELARANMLEFMQSRIGTKARVLMEKNNLGRDEHDIPTRIAGPRIPERTIADVALIGISDEKEPVFLGKITDYFATAGQVPPPRK
ncbi:MAG: radical SAM protein [Proteobacteria bacterium]|nr:radical SAM protein [Pseudomonadota bacterium]